MHVLQIFRHTFLIYAILHFEIHLQYYVQSRAGFSMCYGYNRTKSIMCMCPMSLQKLLPLQPLLSPLLAHSTPLTVPQIPHGDSLLN